MSGVDRETTILEERGKRNKRNEDRALRLNKRQKDSS
jgi:hypothetical protein